MGLCMVAYMRSNLGLTMTCMINSTAIAMKSIQRPPNDSNPLEHIPAGCPRAHLSRGAVNDYGVSLGSFASFLIANHSF